MLIHFLFLHLHLIKDGLEAADQKSRQNWFVIETKNGLNSKKLPNMDPLFNIIRKKTHSGKEYDIKTI